jgi:PTS system nitrogen regulatory IIA component
VLERVIASLTVVSAPARALLSQRLRSAGGINWAPIGRGFALPHFSARVTVGRDAGVVALLLMRDALPLAEPPPDGVPVQRLFFFVPPSPRAHLEILGRLSRALATGSLRELVERGAPDDALFQALASFDAPGRTEANREEPA